MIPKFTAESIHNPMSTIQYACPTKVENDAQLEDFFHYLKDIAQEGGMGSIKESDLDIFYHLFQIPQKFDVEKVKKLFALLEQLAGAEKFQDVKVAQDCLSMVEAYRTELDL